jgi:hypothetical protein
VNEEAGEVLARLDEVEERLRPGVPGLPGDQRKGVKKQRRFGGPGVQLNFRIEHVFW